MDSIAFRLSVVVQWWESGRINHSSSVQISPPAFSFPPMPTSLHLRLWLLLLALGGIVFADTVLAQAEPAANKTLAYSPVQSAEEAIGKIHELGGLVRKVEPSDGLLEVDFQRTEATLSAEHLQYLLLLKHVVRLQLKGLPIGDEALLHVGRLTSLERLHLERTKVTDAGLAHLSGLSQLTYLNLYGTAIGDAGLAHLEKLPKLKRLYVWDTKVTPAGIAKLQQALPELRIDPDPIAEQRRAIIVWERTKKLQQDAEAALAIAQQDLAELPPKLEQLKKDAEAAKPVVAETKKQAEAARKQLDEANRRASDAKRAAEDAQKQSQGKPDDAALKSQAETQRKAADEARQQAEAAKAADDAAQQQAKLALQKENDARKLVDRASNAKRAAEAAEQAVATYQKLTQQAAEKVTALGGTLP